MTRYLRIAVSALFVAIVIAACSSNDNAGTSSPTTAPAGAAATTADTGAAATTTADSGGSQAAAVTIQNFKFGAPLTVKPGATVTVTNQDSAQHNAVADDGSFKTPLLAKGESATFTAPSKAGTYKYSCTVHASMTSIGTLVVSG